MAEVSNTQQNGILESDTEFLGNNDDDKRSLHEIINQEINIRLNNCMHLNNNQSETNFYNMDEAALSVKDRMFLAIDKSAHLFTQTLTSTPLILSPDDDECAHHYNNYTHTLTSSSSSESGVVTTSGTTTKKKRVKRVKKSNEKENISVKSSFNKFDALSKKTVLHVRSSDVDKAQEKFNGTTVLAEANMCKNCAKTVFQMELVKAERAIWHKNCFRCFECAKQLNVDSYESHEGKLYCKPHFRNLFAPKVIEDGDDEMSDAQKQKPELIIRENQPKELPPDVIRASSKSDLGLEELQSLNVKEKFQKFEKGVMGSEEMAPVMSPVAVKRSASILSKLAKFQAKGFDVGIPDEQLNGISVNLSPDSSEAETDEDNDVDLIRAKRVQREKPCVFNQMDDMRKKWECGHAVEEREERREERKQELQSIRNRLFHGKQVRMKEAYQQAIEDSVSGAKVKKTAPITPDEVSEARAHELKVKFEQGQLVNNNRAEQKFNEDMAVFEAGLSKQSRSLFLELDANVSKTGCGSISPNARPLSPRTPKRDSYLSNYDNVVKSDDALNDVQIETAEVANKFKFFETYQEPVKPKKEFRITPPRDGQVKMDVDEVDKIIMNKKAAKIIEDPVIAKETHTATRMLNVFRQMEEQVDEKRTEPPPLKCFTPPRDGEKKNQSETSEEEEDVDDGEHDESKNGNNYDPVLAEAQKAARAKQLRAKFEKWELNEQKKNGSHIYEQELLEGDAQIESTKVLRAKFENLNDSKQNQRPKIKVNRFV